MELSQAEKNVFGESAKPHPVTGMAIETGHGSLSEQQQAYLHLNVIHHHHGKEHADKIRARLDIHYRIAKDEATAIAQHIPLPEKD